MAADGGAPLAQVPRGVIQHEQRRMLAGAIARDLHDRAIVGIAKQRQEMTNLTLTFVRPDIDGRRRRIDLVEDLPECQAPARAYRDHVCDGRRRRGLRIPGAGPTGLLTWGPIRGRLGIGMASAWGAARVTLDKVIDARCRRGRDHDACGVLWQVGQNALEVFARLVGQDVFDPRDRHRLDRIELERRRAEQGQDGRRRPDDNRRRSSSKHPAHARRAGRSDDPGP
jgi:hypothetical protein